MGRGGFDWRWLRTTESRQASAADGGQPTADNQRRTAEDWQVTAAAGGQPPIGGGASGGRAGLGVL